MAPAVESPSLSPPDPRLPALLEPFPAELFSDRFYHSWELVDRYGGEWALELERRLGLAAALGVARSAEDLRRDLGLDDGFRHALDWLLRFLAAQGLLAVEEDATLRFRATGVLPPPRLESVRRAALEVDPAIAASLDLLDAAGTAYPAVARGETRGQEALFGLGQTQLWLSYFSNDNPVYAINNRLAAFAAAEHGQRQGLRVLELGGGPAAPRRWWPSSRSAAGSVGSPPTG